MRNGRIRQDEFHRPAAKRCGRDVTDDKTVARADPVIDAVPPAQATAAPAFAEAGARPLGERRSRSR